MLHDPDGLLVLEDEDVSKSLAAAVDNVRQRRVTGEWLVNRAIDRGHVAEAVQWYLRFPLDSAGPSAAGRALSLAPRLRAALPA